MDSLDDYRYLRGYYDGIRNKAYEGGSDSSSQPFRDGFDDGLADFNMMSITEITMKCNEIAQQLKEMRDEWPPEKTP